MISQHLIHTYIMIANGVKFNGTHPLDTHPHMI